MSSLLGLAAALVLLVIPGCGRIGFDQRDDGGTDGDASVGAPLGCEGARGPIVDPADPRLLGFWSFNDNILPATDYSSSGVQGDSTVSTAVILNFGLGHSYSTSGSSIDMAAPDGTYDGISSGMTVEVWATVTPQQCGLNAAYFLLGAGGAAGWELGCEKGAATHFIYRTAAGEVRAISPVPDNGAWHHLAGVVRDDRTELWIDGTLITTVPSSLPAPAAGTSSIHMGPIAAAFDELRLWRTAFSPAEIRARAQFAVPDLVAYWSLDTGFTGFAGLPDGAGIGSVEQLAGGRAGGAASFLGISGRIESPLTYGFGTDYTASAWIKTTHPGKQTVFYRMGIDTRVPIHLWLDADRVTASIQVSNTVPNISLATDAQLTDGCWHHVAVRRTGDDGQPGSLALYIDGVMSPEVSGMYGTTSETAEPFRIGYGNTIDPGPFQGLIDEVQIYERALTTGEIKGLYEVLR